GRRVGGARGGPGAVPAAGEEASALAGSEPLPEATVVVDSLWGEPGERALAAAARGVRYVQLGQSAGPTATLQSAWVRGKLANILGHSLWAGPRPAFETGYRELCEPARASRVRLELETYELDAIADAWARQSSGSPG